MFFAKTRLLAVAPAVALVIAGTLASLATGCVARTSAAQLASDGSGSEDVASTESDLESLGTSFVADDGQSVATAQVTASAPITAGIPTFDFEPAACVTVTADAASSTDTYTFAGCTGPLGLVELTGTVSVGWRLAGSQLTLNFSASGFQINRATIDNWQATAVITATGSQRSMTWNATLSGTTGSGRAFSRTNQKNVAWTAGVACLTASGQSSGNILGVDLQTTVLSWQRCAYACPQSGSEISVKDLDKGDTIDIKYGGGDTAELTVDGRSDEIRLACGL